MFTILSRKRVLGFMLAAVVALAVAGCGSGGGSTTASGGGGSTTATGGGSASGGSGGGSASSGAAMTAAKVDIANFKYGPPTVTVKKGGTITWTNSDSTAHTATQTPQGSGFDTGTLNQGASKTVTFDKPGTYQYVCLFHAFMHGTVKVVG